MSQPVLVVGVGAEGPDSLLPALQKRIAQADQLWGGARLLAHWDGHPAQMVVLGAQLARLIPQLRDRGEDRVVILASGDPGFYGIAGTLLHYLPPEELEIIPYPTSLQVAFAHAGICWSDAVFTSAHARSLAEVVGWAKHAKKLGILTDRHHSPGVIARELLAGGVQDCRAIVAENLCLPDESLVDTSLSQLPGMVFGPLNVLLVLHEADWRPHPTFLIRPDAAYAHRHGLITKADVRALSLSRLMISETDTVWDIGAGSGAVSIEMASLAWRGQVFAVEYNAENLGYIRENLQRFGAYNVELVEGYAPPALAGLPSPSAVFIGGTGGAMVEILNYLAAAALPGCRVVMNLATLENLYRALHAMKQVVDEFEVAQVNIAQGKALEEYTRLAPLNPVFILSGILKKGGEQHENRK